MEITFRPVYIISSLHVLFNNHFLSVGKLSNCPFIINILSWLISNYVFLNYKLGTRVVSNLVVC